MSTTMFKIDEFPALAKTADEDGVVRRKGCTVLGVALVEGEPQFVVYLSEGGKIWPEFVPSVEPHSDTW